MRPRIACVHATPRSIAPTAAWFRDHADEFEAVDLLEERLFDLGGEGDEAVSLFFEVLERAERHDPAAILTACSIYTPYLPEARRRFRTPLVGINEPLIERAAAVTGTLALVGSMPASLEFTERLIQECASGKRGSPIIVQKVQVDPDRCVDVEGTRAFAKELRLLLEQVDTVVVVQASLSPVANVLTKAERHTILTSPILALDRLREILGTHSDAPPQPGKTR